MKELRVEKLCQESFAQFGDVIEVKSDTQLMPINHGYTKRYHDLAQIDVAAKGGRPLINIFRSTPLTQPVVIELMERHPLSSQAFFPLGSNPYLVVVAPAGEFNQSLIRAFYAQASQGVNYHAGTWHHFCLALNEVSDFLVVDRGGPEENCDEVYLEQPFVLSMVAIKD